MTLSSSFPFLLSFPFFFSWHTRKWKKVASQQSKAWRVKEGGIVQPVLDDQIGTFYSAECYIVKKANDSGIQQVRSSDCLCFSSLEVTQGILTTGTLLLCKQQQQQ